MVRSQDRHFLWLLRASWVKVINSVEVILDDLLYLLIAWWQICAVSWQTIGNLRIAWQYIHAAVSWWNGIGWGYLAGIEWDWHQWRSWYGNLSLTQIQLLWASWHYVWILNFWHWLLSLRWPFFLLWWVRGTLVNNSCCGSCQSWWCANSQWFWLLCGWYNKHIMLSRACKCETTNGDSCCTLLLLPACLSSLFFIRYPCWWDHHEKVLNSGVGWNRGPRIPVFSVVRMMLNHIAYSPCFVRG